MEAVILLAHGAPENLDAVEEYLLRVRHGRPLDPEKVQQIRERYSVIGGSPLLPWTNAQALALENLFKSHSMDKRVYVGMRYSPPFIHDAVRQIIHDEIHFAKAICLAPQFSKLTIGAYKKALEEAVSGANLQFEMVFSYAKHPQLISAFAAKLMEAMNQHPGAFVIFTAHSLPEAALVGGDPYDHETKTTASLVARKCGLPDWRFAYQSQGMTSDKWLGPSVDSRIDELASKGVSEVIVQPIGFVSDHMEILYDIDIQYRQYAAAKGIALFRAPSLNDSPLFIELLFQLAQ